MHLLALVAVGLIVTTKVRAQRSSGGCDVVPDGLSACASPTSFHICHKRAPLPFAFSCPEDEYCCNGGCSPNPVCEKWNPCSETEVGIACVDITSFKHCVNNSNPCLSSFTLTTSLEFYWEKPQQCAPGTLCCNNACLHENDDACDAEKDKYEVRKRELRVLLERVTGDDEFDYAKWEMGPAQWKDYFGRKEVTYRSHEVYVNKKVVGVWNFGFASGDCQDDIIKTNRVIYPITSTGLPAGPPIFEKIPQDEGYSDAVLRYDLLITDEEECPTISMSFLSRMRRSS
ncbi:hypothetical protein BC829DRAFT_225457 [Chytridium lagenaria]|nr:hypothetical protein BC829DRAFT_225457 [Chytridium lagenaria]